LGLSGGETRNGEYGGSGSLDDEVASGELHWLEGTARLGWLVPFVV
jgi:hypothetical protein